MGLLAGCAAHRPPKAVDKYLAGRRAAEAGNTEAAMSSLSQAVDENPDLIMPRILLGDILLSKDDYSKAADQFKALTELDPYDYRNHYKLGFSYQMLSKLQDAAGSYLRALQLRPDDAKVNLGLGVVYLTLGQLPDAVKYIERSTQLDGNSAEAFASLGLTYDRLGQYQKAEAAFRRSLELKDNPTTLLNLGVTLTHAGRTSEAIATLKQAVGRVDTPLAHRRYGEALAAAKNYDEALKQYEMAMKLDPRYYPAMNEIGRARIAQYKAGLQLDEAKRKEAVEMWKRSLAINPDQGDIGELVKQWDKGTLFH